MSCLMYAISDEKFLELIRRSSSIKEVLQTLGYTNNSGENNLLFHQRCEELGIDWKKELRTKNYTRTKRTVENVFCKDSTADQTTLKSWYIKGEYSPYQCAICGVNEWNGKELILRLDHINGDNKDNRLENLRWLCPNCDSQQDTYCGRNLKYQPFKEQPRCIECGKPITKKKGVLRCSECAATERRKVINRPSKEELYESLKDSSFTAVGKKYNVTDNAIRKWCRDYGLSVKANDYKAKKEKKEYNPETNKSCAVFTKDGVLIKSFKSVREASEWTLEHSSATTINGIDSHIKEVCKGIRKTAYGYKWKYIE